MSKQSILVQPPEFAKFRAKVADATVVKSFGKITQVVGLVAEASGPNARIGDECLITSCDGETVVAEVAGFRGDKVLLMPLREMTGMRAGDLVRSTGSCLQVPVGPELLGRCINALGEPIDDLGEITTSANYPIEANPPNALKRSMISEVFETGVRAIDGTLTVGVGQRVGIFAGSGVGKSTLMGMIARHGVADVNVIALVGERGREVKEFIHNDLGLEGLKKSIIVCATSDEPSLMRIKAALTATAICEFFRDQGLNVLLMMDSVTRYAMALRELGLAIGEPPSTKGYTPSVFANLPRLMERAGCSDKGSITAIYTVLVDGDDTNEPIADATRSILDGHIVLSRRLTSQGHYPPIDVEHSLSRVMPMVVQNDQVRNANRMRELMAAHSDVADLIAIGAYQDGSRPDADEAIRKIDDIRKFLRQDRGEKATFSSAVTELDRIVHA